MGQTRMYIVKWQPLSIDNGRNISALLYLRGEARGWWGLRSDDVNHS